MCMRTDTMSDEFAHSVVNQDDDQQSAQDGGRVAEQSDASSRPNEYRGERGQYSDADVSAYSRVDQSGWADTDPDSPHLDSAVPTGMDDELTARTTFDPSDGDGDNWEWLAELNRGRGQSGVNGDGRDRARQIAGMHRDVDVAIERLHGTDHERERVKFLLSRVDAKADLLQNGAIEAIVLGVVSIVVDEQRTKAARQCATQKNSTMSAFTSVLNDDAFADLCDAFEVDISKVRLVRIRLRGTDVYQTPNSM